MSTTMLPPPSQQQPPQPGAPSPKAPKPKTGMTKKIGCGCGVLVLVVIGLIVVMTGKGSDDTTKPASPSASVSASTVPAHHATTAVPAPAPAPVKKAPAVPPEYKNALAKARDYLNFMAFSKEGLYGQLVSPEAEQFSPKAARYAVEHVHANWDEQAAKKARSYSETMHMSPAAIRTQLVSFEKFTPAQAAYGVKHMNDE